jgi:hypothetical protein
MSLRLRIDPLAIRGSADRGLRAQLRRLRGGALRNWLFSVALLGSLTIAPLAHAQGSWLDQPAGSDNWNYAGMPVPVAAVQPAEDRPPNCGQDVRWAETYEDQVLEQHGWLLLGAYQAGWGTKVVYGQSGFDGMCRPTGYQGFVFVDGVFAGTVSPMPMDSRSDGAETDTHLFARDRLVVRYNRYAASDPLCCPSASSTVIFDIHETPDGPVTTPATITTSPNSGG